MATKSERIEMRADHDNAAKIARAAEIARKSVSAFALEAAASAADRILARTDHVTMPAEQFDSILRSLDEPDEAPTLSRLAQRERRFKRA